MESLGKHVILEMYGCKFESLNDEELIINTFKKAVEEAKMTLLDLTSHQFKPFGVTALALLGESHMSIHTYPELGYAAADVFTCGDEGDPFKAMEVLVNAIQPGRKNIIYTPRGTDIREEDKDQEAIKVLEEYISKNGK